MQMTRTTEVMFVVGMGQTKGIPDFFEHGSLFFSPVEFNFIKFIKILINFN